MLETASRGRRWLLAGLSVAAGCIATLVVLEIGLRFAPVSSALRSVEVNEENPVFHFQPDRDVTYSKGWRFNHVNELRVNNAGFVNLHDYVRDNASPLVAVVGDSYVEGLIVGQAETLHARLAERVAPKARVYSFAASGAPLSQYIVWAEHAARTYGARGGIVLVVGNDFDESLGEVKQGPGFHHFFERDGVLSLELVPYRPNALRRTIRFSALARYLVFHLKVLQLPAPQLPALLRRSGAESGDVGKPREAPVFVGNTFARVDPALLGQSERVVDRFLEELLARTGWSAHDVIIVTDGSRIFDPAARAATQAAYFPRMARYLRDRARARGITVVDMQPVFLAHHAVHGRRFDFADDGHWNGLAHALAAEAIAATPAFQGLGTP